MCALGEQVPAPKAEAMGLVDRLAGESSLAEDAIAYARDFVVPTLARRAPTAQERAALEDLSTRLAAIGAGADAEAYQYEVYETGKAHGFENLRDWFKALYEILIGTSNGPRMGSFIALYGLDETLALINESLS